MRGLDGGESAGVRSTAPMQPWRSRPRGGMVLQGITIAHPWSSAIGPPTSAAPDPAPVILLKTGADFPLLVLPGSRSELLNPAWALPLQGGGLAASCWRSASLTRQFPIGRVGRRVVSQPGGSERDCGLAPLPSPEPGVDVECGQKYRIKHRTHEATHTESDRRPDSSWVEHPAKLLRESRRSRQGRQIPDTTGLCQCRSARSPAQPHGWAWRRIGP